MNKSKPATALPVDYKLGEYAIQSVLGRGGFGITYLAQDTRLNTQVAIKEYFPVAYAARNDDSITIHPYTTSAGAAVENYDWGLSEFLKEAQALARFKHPHIVRVLRFLETNGTAYMVMEYEAGESLLGYLGRHGGFLSEQMLVGIFIPVLTGLQAVHDAGVLHLDIKPDNIYLRKDGQPMLIDFGSSRQTREDAATDQKVTLSRGYAAPEQYPGFGERGPWSDVYGIGASLYRCVTAREPVDSMERRSSLEKKHVDAMAPAASFDRPHYAPHIRAAIDAALSLDDSARPRTARALQNGLMGKELKDEQTQPWMAYGRGAGYIGVTRGGVQQRHRRRVRRSFVEKLLAVTVFIAAMAVSIPKVMIGTGHLGEDELYASLDQARNAVRSIPRRAKQFVDEDILGAKPSPPAAPRRALPVKIAAAQNIPPFQLMKETRRSFALTAPVSAVAVLLDGAVVATALNDGTVQAWDGRSGEAMRTLSPKAQGPSVVVASPDGRWLAYTGADRSVYLWDPAHDKLVGPMQGHEETINALAFSADGKLLASAGEDMKVNLWNLDSASVERTVSSRSAVLALAFSPNMRTLAAADATGSIQYWEMQGGTELAYTPVQDDGLTALAYAPDGKWLAVVGRERFARLLDLGLDRRDRSLSNLPDVVSAVAYSPDGKWLLVAGAGEAIEIRDIQTGNVTNRLAAQAHAVRTFALSNDGAWLASADDNNTVWLWH